jgi:hypothetical protein
MRRATCRHGCSGRPGREGMTPSWSAWLALEVLCWPSTRGWGCSCAMCCTDPGWQPAASTRGNPQFC